MKKDLRYHTARYVNVSDLVPKNWNSWFWASISDNAPFTWGSNNHSLVDVESFIEAFELRRRE